MLDRIPPTPPSLSQAHRPPPVTPPLAAAMRATTSAVRAALGRLDTAIPAPSLKGRVSTNNQGANPIQALAQNHLTSTPSEA